jgi:hypothetical protein
MRKHNAVEVLRDEDGAIQLGWVGAGVFLAQFDRGLSARLGTAYASRLQSLAAEGLPFEFFADARLLTYYDVVARSAFVRVVLENRRMFKALTMLTWAEGISPMARAFTALIGEPVTVLSDPVEFESSLLRSAPSARERLGLGPVDPQRPPVRSRRAPAH